jgi:hypothetical protein
MQSDCDRMVLQIKSMKVFKTKLPQNVTHLRNNASEDKALLRTNLIARIKFEFHCFGGRSNS